MLKARKVKQYNTRIRSTEENYVKNRYIQR